MALFGAQLVITMIVASFLQKLSPHFSLARWLLCSRLVRYLHPSTEELRQLAVVATNNKRKNKNENRRLNGVNKRSQEEAGMPMSTDTFKVPRSLDIRLDSARIQPVDVINLHFYSEYQWLVDFSACCLVVYLLTEMYFYLLPNRDEFNLSLMWCLMVIALSLYDRKVLFSVTALYFHGDESSGERSMCVTCGFFFFVLAMAVLVVDENILEFGLDKAYLSFCKSVASFLESQGMNTKNTASIMGFKFLLAVWCGLVGAFFTFPGLRFAKMHYDSLKYSSESPILRLVLHASFVAPLFLILLWVKPLARDYFTVRTFTQTKSTLMTPESFETSRLIAVVVVVFLRLALMPCYLQSYLNMAHERMDDLKKEAGKITNVEIQKKVARVFYYLCVVALQYIAPLLMCCFFTLLLKTLGGYSWTSYFNHQCTDPTLTTPTTATSTTSEERSADDITDADSILAASQHFSLALANVRRVFTPVLYRGLLNFATWWLCSVWFATSAVGLIYHSYFAAQ